MKRRAIALLLLAAAASPAEAADKPRPAVLLVVQAARGQPSLGGVEHELIESRRYRIVLMQALVPLMQQADRRNEVPTRARDLMEQGRKAMVALDQATARTRLDQALELLDRGFVRYYDPRVVAQAHLLLGVIALEQQARPDLARQQFVEVHRLDPGFKLDAHYSPRVRGAFEEAGRSLPPAPAPAADDLLRLASLAEARLAIVLTVQGAGEQSLVQGSIFVPSKQAYTGVVSRLVDPSDNERMRRQARGLGRELRAALEARFPAPAPPKKIDNNKKKKLPPPPPPPPTPWYKRWYTWTAVGVAVAAAVVLPLALRTKTTDVVVELP